MKTEYKPYMRQKLVVGQMIDIEGTEWYCFEPCVLLGATLKTNAPVIDCGYGAMLAKMVLRRKSECASIPKQGCTNIENTILTRYKKIGVDQLVGEEIITVHDGYASCIIVTANSEYVKLGIHRDYDDDVSLSNEDLTLHDLLTLELIAEDIWRAHEREVDGTIEESKAREREQEIYAAKKLLGIL